MTDLVERIAEAILYEGYLLYPYRPSAVKNRQRFNFGVLRPEGTVDPAGSDRSTLQAECLLEGPPDAVASVKVRFLQLTNRPDRDPTRPWQEATERSVRYAATVAHLGSGPWTTTFGFPGLGYPGLAGIVEVSADLLAASLTRIRVRVTNRSHPGPRPVGRVDLLIRSLVSTHVILSARGGDFVSLIDPPGERAAAAASCHNEGVWPVLVGAEGSRGAMLASPIILYDYPTIAPESAGDLFDGTEIDEILSLRIMTLTDEEKREIRESDDRARRLLERTEALTPEDLMRLHGVMRRLDPSAERAP